MKIRKYTDTTKKMVKKIFERGNYYSPKDKEEDKEEMLKKEINNDEKQVMETTCELLEKLFISAKFENVWVGNEGLVFQIQYYLDTEMTLTNLKDLMSVFIKIKDDTLKDYDCDFNIYTTETEESDEDVSSFIEVDYFQRSSKPHNTGINTTGLSARDFDSDYENYY